MENGERDAGSLLTLIVLGALCGAMWIISSIVIFGTIKVPF